MDLTCPQCRHTISVPVSAGDRPVKCQNCGARVDLPESGEPEPVAPPTDPRTYMPAPAPPGYGAAIASLVCALIFFVPLVTQALAVGLGVYALIRLRGAEGRRAPAWAGLILGLIVGVGWSLLLAFSLSAWGRSGYTATSYVTLADSVGQGKRLDRIRTGLERISYALSAYRRDMGRWPSDPEQLVPTYLAEAVLDQVDPDRSPTNKRLITFVPGVDPLADPPDRIVAYSVPVQSDEFGERLASPQRWVLLLNGQTKALDAAEVEAALAEKPH